MSWSAVAGAAVGVIGGAISSNSASKAAETQSNAATVASNNALQTGRETNQLTADLYKSGLAQQAPYQQGGQLALSSLMGGLGLGPAKSSVSGQPMGQSGPAGMYVNAQGQPVDAQGNIITSNGVDYGLGGVNYGATQSELDAAGGLAPGYFTHNFDANDLKAGIDPGYQFRIDQGNAALNAKRAAVGNRFGGQALKDISNYNQDLAATEYQSAFTRYNQNKTNLFDRLSNLAGLGSSAGSAAASAGTSAAGQISNNAITSQSSANDYLTSGAAARAGGTVGSTNAIVNGVNNGLNNWYTYRTMGNLNNQRAGPNIWSAGYDGAEGGWTGQH